MLLSLRFHALPVLTKNEPCLNIPKTPDQQFFFEYTPQVANQCTLRFLVVSPQHPTILYLTGTCACVCVSVCVRVTRSKQCSLPMLQAVQHENILYSVHARRQTFIRMDCTDGHFPTAPPLGDNYACTPIQFNLISYVRKSFSSRLSSSRLIHTSYKI